MKPGKTLKVGGHVTTTIDGNKLIIEATEGLCVATTADLEGGVVFMFHPLSGWYIEVDMRKDKGDGEVS